MGLCERVGIGLVREQWLGVWRPGDGSGHIRGGGHRNAESPVGFPGVWLGQLTEDGLALELTVKGTKYYKDDELD